MIEYMNNKDTALRLTPCNLKPCPFCGGTDIRQHSGYPLQVWSIKCKHCGGKIQLYGSREQAITAWNRRIHND